MPESIQSRSFRALGKVLREHYGTFADSPISDARNYATLWDTLLDALEHDTIDHTDIDRAYITLTQGDR